MRLPRGREPREPDHGWCRRCRWVESLWCLPGVFKAWQRSRGSRAVAEGIAFLELDVQAERLDFLDQHVERFGRAGLQRVVALDERLVDFRAALHVVGFDREQFLERVRRTIGFERPHFHFAKTLA